MKKLISLILVLVFAWQAHAQSSHDLTGKWRGLLTVQDQIKIVIGLTISGDQVTLDSPNQGAWGQALEVVQLTDSQLQIRARNLNISYQAEFVDGQLRGTFTQGRELPLVLNKLSARDLERLEFEGRYAGELNVDANTQLPLVVNAAVIKDYFYGTLDSPAQQTFGIPLPGLKIDSKQLKFTAPMLGASYTGDANDGGYSGFFTQGRVFQLELRKLASGEQVQVAEPVFGEVGGAVYVRHGDQVETKYFADSNPATQFEIGSVTKTFVGYLLAQQVSANQLSLDTRLNQYFKDAPESITLGQLATHTSGLPRLPDNLLAQADPEDPYRDYTRELLTTALAQEQIDTTEHSYSNYGMGALAEALAIQQQTSLADLLQREVFEPAQMRASYLATDAEYQPDTLAKGYDTLGREVPHWHFASLAGAGAIVSNLPDVVAYIDYLQAQFAQQDGAVELLLSPQLTLAECCQQALGWMLKKDASGKLFAWHNGRTAGFSSYVGFYLDGSAAVVILANQAIDVNAMAEQLLQQKLHLEQLD